MKLIDKLLSKVQAQTERLNIAFITLDEITGLYEADCRLWDGVWGSGGRTIHSEQKSEQEAFDTVDRIEEQYPNKKVVLIYGDYALED